MRRSKAEKKKAAKTTTRRASEKPKTQRSSSRPASAANVTKPAQRAAEPAIGKTERPSEPVMRRPERSTVVTWIRGKLPRDTFIKTNSVTGAFVVITREEWETLA